MLLSAHSSDQIISHFGISQNPITLPISQKFSRTPALFSVKRAAAISHSVFWFDFSKNFWYYKVKDWEEELLINLFLEAIELSIKLDYTLQTPEERK